MLPSCTIFINPYHSLIVKWSPVPGPRSPNLETRSRSRSCYWEHYLTNIYTCILSKYTSEQSVDLICISPTRNVPHFSYSVARAVVTCAISDDEVESYSIPSLPGRPLIFLRLAREGIAPSVFLRGPSKTRFSSSTSGVTAATSA